MVAISTTFHVAISQEHRNPTREQLLAGLEVGATSSLRGLWCVVRQFFLSWARSGQRCQAGLQGELVRAMRVSPSTGLRAPLCTLLVPINSLTSRFDREEGLCAAARPLLGVDCLAVALIVTGNSDPE